MLDQIGKFSICLFRSVYTHIPFFQRHAS
jgi:hypothetical protein